MTPQPRSQSPGRSSVEDTVNTTSATALSVLVTRPVGNPVSASTSLRGRIGGGSRTGGRVRRTAAESRPRLVDVSAPLRGENADCHLGSLTAARHAAQRPRRCRLTLAVSGGKQPDRDRRYETCHRTAVPSQRRLRQPGSGVPSPSRRHRWRLGAGPRPEHEGGRHRTVGSGGSARVRANTLTATQAASTVAPFTFSATGGPRHRTTIASTAGKPERDRETNSRTAPRPRYRPVRNRLSASPSRSRSLGSGSTRRQRAHERERACDRRLLEAGTTVVSNPSPRPQAHSPQPVTSRLSPARPRRATHDRNQRREQPERDQSTPRSRQTPSAKVHRPVRNACRRL